ncbi:RHS repeat-associated core domain-containing protein [Flammeovirga kamogawensis]|uniref:SH3 domain-containing protein n=2 Tax=Flammeovirga kamogawensis TaxID=373891 RepID=A0ABX8H466_9BACT|nr:RHS repeat-associated core domain-containing protein [Flammeovirga kamogawensis]QWG10696.1 SH3 domain-containing protein [Flammeovirga kamogawensis]TRX63798.1 SH3 domain-containing protein [Flammeovirga kamogawensis]
MATYSDTSRYSNQEILSPLQIAELPIYGSSRLGQYTPSVTIQSQLGLGHRRYELSNHLGNVLVTYSDAGHVLSYSDYYPFGLSITARSSGSEGYRYGFNGKENDTDLSSSQLIQDYGFRVYNPVIGKFLSVDPLTKSYPMLTPYQFASNMPIWAIDLDGLERLIYTKKRLYHEDINKKITWSVVANSGRLQWMNDVNSQDVKYDHDTHEGGGPIPEGSYFISLENSNERVSKGDKNLSNGLGWGKYGIRLDYNLFQAAKLKLFYNDRSGFYLHEDGNQNLEGGLGSGGCIACTKGGDILKVRDQLVEYQKSQFNAIDVVVDYDYKPDLNYKINTKSDPLNFRSSPGGKKIGTLEKDSYVIGTGNTRGKWTEVQNNDGKVGWVGTDYLKEE